MLKGKWRDFNLFVLMVLFHVYLIVGSITTCYLCMVEFTQGKFVHTYQYNSNVLTSLLPRELHSCYDCRWIHSRYSIPPSVAPLHFPPEALVSPFPPGALRGSCRFLFRSLVLVFGMRYSRSLVTGKYCIILLYP